MFHTQVFRSKIAHKQARSPLYNETSSLETAILFVLVARFIFRLIVPLVTGPATRECRSAQVEESHTEERKAGETMPMSAKTHCIFAFRKLLTRRITMSLGHF